MFSWFKLFNIMFLSNNVMNSRLVNYKIIKKVPREFYRYNKLIQLNSNQLKPNEDHILVVQIKKKLLIWDKSIII